MQKYAILISYCGTEYCGWQKQKGSAAFGKTSIQQILEESLERITGEKISVVGSGRTDSGVHALGQVAHFILSKKRWDFCVLERALNGLLPASIRVLSVQPIDFGFHAQRSAEKKQYSYYFQQGSCALPYLIPSSWWIRKKMNFDQMSQAVQCLVGEHDFKAFQASGAKPGSTVRRIFEAQVSFEPIPFPRQVDSELWADGSNWGLVRFRVVGTGFLKQMVRGIAGTLLQVGEGRRDPSCMIQILESRDRSLVGPTAPARALWLEKVEYPAGFKLKWETLTF